MSRIAELYKNEIKTKLLKELGLKNIMQVPKLEKIVINMGLGEATSNIKLIDKGVEEISLIAGQKPVVTKAKKAISNFKLRKGLPIGVMVTLRRERMYEFLERFLTVTLPRVRDFKGISAKAFDGKGNYTIGVKEQLIFPEIDYDKVEKVKGMNITFVTTAKNDKEARALLSALGFPFRD
ncbi:MAG: 50S ribosomal protein L5 [bacterium]